MCLRVHRGFSIPINFSSYCVNPLSSQTGKSAADVYLENIKTNIIENLFKWKYDYLTLSLIQTLSDASAADSFLKT